MHGLVNRSIEHFLREGYGQGVWQQIAQAAGCNPDGFNGLHRYSGAVTDALLHAASDILGKSGCEILEDTGASLIRCEAIRRLLRFSGGDFGEFVLSLEELPGRARMVLPDIAIPAVTVTLLGADSYLIQGREWQAGLPWMIAGALRGMADDYGVLALIEAGGDGVRLSVLDGEYAQSRPFAIHSGTAAVQGA